MKIKDDKRRNILERDSCTGPLPKGEIFHRIWMVVHFMFSFTTMIMLLLQSCVMLCKVMSCQYGGPMCCQVKVMMPNNIFTLWKVSDVTLLRKVFTCSVRAHAQAWRSGWKYAQGRWGWSGKGCALPLRTLGIGDVSHKGGHPNKRSVA